MFCQISISITRSGFAPLNLTPQQTLLPPSLSTTYIFPLGKFLIGSLCTGWENPHSSTDDPLRFLISICTDDCPPN
jgi:hypothetical protein